MHFQAEAKELYRAVSFVERGAQRKASNETKKLMRLSVHGDTLSLSSYHDSVHFVSSVPVIGMQDGVTFVHANRFRLMMKNKVSKKDDVNFSVNQVAQTLEATDSRNIASNTRIMDAQDFNPPPNYGELHWVTVSSAEVAEAFKTFECFLGRQQLKVPYSKVFISNTEKGLLITAGNGTGFMRQFVPGSLISTRGHRFTLPSRLLHRIGKAMSETEKCQRAVSGPNILLQLPLGRIIIETKDAEYPNVNSFFSGPPNKPRSYATFDRNGLLQLSKEFQSLELDIGEKKALVGPVGSPKDRQLRVHDFRGEPFMVRLDGYELMLYLSSLHEANFVSMSTSIGHKWVTMSDPTDRFSKYVQILAGKNSE